MKAPISFMLASLFGLALSTGLYAKDTRPNILWITIEDWSERKPGQPFFARITFGGTHRAWNRDPQRPIDIEDIELPPDYPDTPFCRRDWANGLEQMSPEQEKAFIENVSIRGLGGRWIIDYSDRERNKGEGVQSFHRLERPQLWLENGVPSVLFCGRNGWESTFVQCPYSSSSDGTLTDRPKQ